jgi:two-component system chemotaxis sensor kinase CheA
VDLEKYRTLFVDETTDHLAEMAGALADLERRDAATSAEEAVDTLFRMAHSIKGMAASLDYLAVSSLAHRLEDWLEPARKGMPIPADGIQLVYEVMGALEQMVQGVASAGEVPAPRDDLIARLGSDPSAALSADRAAPLEVERRLSKKAPRHGRLSRCRRYASAPKPSTASWPPLVS